MSTSARPGAAGADLPGALRDGERRETDDPEDVTKMRRKITSDTVRTSSDELDWNCSLISASTSRGGSGRC